MYHFVNLNDEQQLRRRELLDFYGLAAQLSVLIPLVAIAIGFLLQKLLSNWTREPQSSPRAKAARRFDFSNVKSRWRRVCNIKDVVKYCVLSASDSSMTRT